MIRACIHAQDATSSIPPPALGRRVQCAVIACSPCSCSPSLPEAPQVSAMPNQSSACSRAVQVLITGVLDLAGDVLERSQARLSIERSQVVRVCTSPKNSLTPTHACYAFIGAFFLQGQTSRVVLLLAHMQPAPAPDTIQPCDWFGAIHGCIQVS